MLHAGKRERVSGVVAAALFAAAACAQTESGSISGQVINAVTGEPVRKAEVLLRWANNPAQPYGAIADSSGHFVLAGVEPGTYRLAADRNGFVRTEYGARKPNRRGRPFVLAAGQQMQDVVVRLWPQGVITGRVIDEDGDPVATAGVQLLQYHYVRGRRELMPGMSSFTNDLGEFRLHGLSPGAYYLRVNYRASAPVLPSSSSDTINPTYAPVYYPNAGGIHSAVPLQLAAGAQVEGIAMRLVRTPTVKVAGQVVSDSPLAGRPVVMLMPRDEAGMPMRGATQAQGPEGRFEIRGVLPGSYTLVAELGGAGGRRSLARLPLDVGQSDVEGLQLVLLPSADVPGRIRVEGDAPLNVATLRVTATPRGGGPRVVTPATSSIQPDGAFVLPNVAADDYVVNVNGAPQDWYVKSMRLGQQDVLENGFNGGSAAGQTLEILLSPEGGRIEGVVADADGQPAAGAAIALVPDDRHREHAFQSTSSDEHGRFTLRGISPGDYKLFAFEDVEPDAWQDPDFLKPFESQGSALTLAAGGSQAVQLKVLPE